MSVQAKIPVHEDVFTQSFALQYISLILFILIFSIAAYMPKEEIKVVETPPQKVPIAEAAPEQSALLTTSSTQDLLVRGTMKLEAMQPYITLINNHDLNLRVTFFWNEKVSRYAALTRARQMREYLSLKGVPVESFIIETRYGTGNESAIAVNKGASAWNGSK